MAPLLSLSAFMIGLRVQICLQRRFGPTLAH
jgi:hypothetical protein